MSSALEELEIISSFLELVVYKIESIKKSLGGRLTESQEEFVSNAVVNHINANGRINDVGENSFLVDNNPTVIHPIIKIEEEYESNSQPKNEGFLSLASVRKEYDPIDEITIKGYPVISEVKRTVKDSKSLMVESRIEKTFGCSQSYQCGKCDFVTKNEGTLKMHIDDLHRGINRFECKICKSTFRRKLGLNIHRRCCHVPFSKSFQCDQCAYSTSEKGNLKTHTDNVHLKIKRFKCETCERAFGIKQSMQRHLKGCKGQLWQQPPISDQKID